MINWERFDEHVQMLLHLLVDLHDCSLVTAAIAIVGGTENSNYIVLLAPVISL